MFGVNVLYGLWCKLSSEAAQLGLSSKTLCPKLCCQHVFFENVKQSSVEILLRNWHCLSFRCIRCRCKKLSSVERLF